MDQLAKRYGQRPSDFVGISNSWLAYQFDLLVMHSALESSTIESSGVSSDSSNSKSEPFAYRSPSTLVGMRGVRVKKVKGPLPRMW